MICPFDRDYLPDFRRAHAGTDFAGGDDNGVPDGIGSPSQSGGGDMICRDLACVYPCVCDRVIGKGVFGEAGVIVFQVICFVKHAAVRTAKNKDMTLTDFDCGSRHDTLGQIGAFAPWVFRARILSGCGVVFFGLVICRVEFVNVFEEFNRCVCLRTPAAEYIDAVGFSVVLGDGDIECSRKSGPGEDRFPFK